jgi:ribosomal protein L37AE/L43A
MPSREATPRVSIAQVRAQLAPRVYRAMTSVRLEHGDAVADVALVEISGHGTVRSPQRRMVCPRCERAVLVLGVVAGAWRCARCGRWRSRDRSRSIKHETPVDVAVEASAGRRADEIAAPEKSAELGGDRQQKRVALAAALNEYWDRVGLAVGDRPSVWAREVQADPARGDECSHRGGTDSSGSGAA